MILYDYWRSSSAWRVRIALAWKGIRYERKAVNLLAREQDGPAFRALNPLGQVPVLVTDDGTLTQSQAILGYLEDRFPTPALLPRTPWLRARAVQLAEMVTSGTQPLQNLSLLDHLRSLGVAEPQAIARHFNARGLAELELVARETAGTFLVGGALSLADVCLVPQLYSARRFGVDTAAYPTLARVEAACAALPAFRGAHPDAQADATPVSETPR
jgi:maleylpyruvate isomerase